MNDLSEFPDGPQQTRRMLRRWAYAAGHIESELDVVVDRMYACVAYELASVLRREADDLHQTETGVVRGLRIGANLINRESVQIQNTYTETPCSPGACEDGGEPCTTHERLMAHAEGDHELCGDECRQALRAIVVQALADALKPRYGGPQHSTPGGLPLTATAEEARLHRAGPLADAVVTALVENHRCV